MPAPEAAATAGVLVFIKEWMWAPLTVAVTGQFLHSRKTKAANEVEVFKRLAAVEKEIEVIKAQFKAMDENFKQLNTNLVALNDSIKKNSDEFVKLQLRLSELTGRVRLVEHDAGIGS